ncbi:PASTA domain-containing protein, partial [Vagococcus fluvialis]
NMYGYSKNRVETYLDSMGLVLDARSEYTDAVPQGQVYYTVPGGGELVSKGSVVTVVFSAGKDPSTIPSTSSSSSSSSSSTSKEEPSKPTEETNGSDTDSSVQDSGS